MGGVEFVKNGGSSREKESSFSLDEKDLLLIGMKFTDSIQRLTCFFIHFREVLMVFGDLKDSRKFVAYRMTGYDPPYDTFLERPNIGITILDKLLRYIGLSFFRSAPDHDFCVFILDLFRNRIHVA